MSPRHLDLIAALVDVECDNYPERAASALAGLSSASWYRLRMDGAPKAVEGGLRAPIPQPARGLRLSLRHEAQDFGTLTLFAADGSDRLGVDGTRLARWGATIFARNLAVLPRLSRSPAESHVDRFCRTSRLRPRERDVVRRLASGAATVDIAESMGLSTATVNTYMKRIFMTLGVHSRVELVALVTGTLPRTRANNGASGPGFTTLETRNSK
jgi:DNA-binding CsgD family transcriptional regulator